MVCSKNEKGKFVAELEIGPTSQLSITCMAPRHPSLPPVLGDVLHCCKGHPVGLRAGAGAVAAGRSVAQRGRQQG